MAARSIGARAPWIASTVSSTTLSRASTQARQLWLSQIKIYFSILQREALIPAEFSSQDAVAARILGFQRHYQRVAKPFDCKFTCRDLRGLVARWAASETQELAVAAWRIRHRTSEPVY